MNQVRNLVPQIRTALGVLLIVLALGRGLVAGKWSWFTVVAITVLGLLLILWNRRIFRASVARTGPEELVVRFAPWYEG